VKPVSTGIRPFRTQRGGLFCLRVFYIDRAIFDQAFTQIGITSYRSKVRYWRTQNGCAVRRWDSAIRSAGLCFDCRLREVDAVPAWPGSTLMTWILWLSGAATALLFAYLVYALLRAEDIE
jgi:K+-transporting ATPase KdpF subunit